MIYNASTLAKRYISSHLTNITFLLEVIHLFHHCGKISGPLILSSLLINFKTTPMDSATIIYFLKFHSVSTLNLTYISHCQNNPMNSSKMIHRLISQLTLKCTQVNCTLNTLTSRKIPPYLIMGRRPSMARTTSINNIPLTYRTSPL